MYLFHVRYDDPNHYRRNEHHAKHQNIEFHSSLPFLLYQDGNNKDLLPVCLAWVCKDEAAEDVLDSQDQETSQPAKLNKINQLAFFIPGKILEWIDLVKVKCFIVQIEVGYIVQRFFQSSC